MDSDELPTTSQFIDWFKGLHADMAKNPAVMETWHTYGKGCRKLRKDCISWLKWRGVPGAMRSEYNQALQKVSKYGHREYLFYKDPRCKLCGKIIERLREVTIDHIIPLSKGGENALYNKQIAHSSCNVEKGDKVIVK